MKIQINISVRNPDWRWIDDDYQKEWVLINGENVAEYSPSVTFGIDADIQQYVKPELDQHAFKFVKEDQIGVPSPVIQEVVLQDLDITEFIYAEGSTPVIISKSILNNVMAAQNQGKGMFYWYYFIKEDVNYVQCERNIWLSQDHYEELKRQVPNLEQSVK